MKPINIGTQFEPIQIPPQGLERDPWAAAGDPSKIDFKKLKDVEFPEADLDVSVGWVIDCSFSAYNYRRVDWTSGTLTTADGTSYSISSGNTGNMSSVTYIYFDETYPNSLQITTSASNSVGEGKILIGVAKRVDSPKLAEFQVFGGKGSNQLITADNIAAGTITGDEIAANSITSGKINVSTLDAISANMGTLTSGTITGAMIQTSSSSYSGIKISSSIGGMNVYGENINIYDTSGTKYGTIGSGGSYFDIASYSGRNIKISPWSGSVFFGLNSGSGIAPLNSGQGNCGLSSQYWANVYSNNYIFSGGHYMNVSNGRIQSNSDFRVAGSIRLTGNMVFENNASITIGSHVFYVTPDPNASGKYYLRT